MKNILKLSLITLAMVISGAVFAQGAPKGKQEPAKKSAKHAAHSNKKAGEGKPSTSTTPAVDGSGNANAPGSQVKATK